MFPGSLTGLQLESCSTSIKWDIILVFLFTFRNLDSQSYETHQYSADRVPHLHIIKLWSDGIRFRQRSRCLESNSGIRSSNESSQLGSCFLARRTSLKFVNNAVLIKFPSNLLKFKGNWQHCIKAEDWWKIAHWQVKARRHHRPRHLFAELEHSGVHTHTPVW